MQLLVSFLFGEVQIGFALAAKNPTLQTPWLALTSISVPRSAPQNRVHAMLTTTLLRMSFDNKVSF